jgi:hypothetical protein
MNTTIKNTNTENIIPKLQNPGVKYSLAAAIIFLIIMLLLIIFKVDLSFKNVPKSDDSIIANTFIILFLGLLILGVCFALLPSLKEMGTLFAQISSVTYVIIYTIGIILFLTMVPEDTLNTYAKYILPITGILGTILFYKGITTNYIENFNVNYERIKMMIIMLCLIAVFIAYYNIDPGGYIEEYFGFSLLITIILTVFAFLYLIIILTVPSDNGGSLYSNMTTFGKYGTLAFIIFLIAITIIISTYKGGFFNDEETSLLSIIIILLICILSGALFISNIFPESTGGSDGGKLSLFKRSLLTLFGLVISSLIIYWIVYNIQSITSQTGLTNFILNALIVVIVLGLIYKTFFTKLPVGNNNKNAFFSLIMNILFYIPCVFGDLIEKVTQEYNATTKNSIIALVIAILIILSYFVFPNASSKLKLHGGTQLVNKPVYTDKLYSLGNYIQLNGSDNIDYQYAISFWTFIDAAPPSTSAAYNKYTSLLNFGYKPNVMYNAEKNTLIVITQQKFINRTESNELLDLDDKNKRIIYKNTNFLLQKWNNIIINYSGGTMDIFLNGELVSSAPNIIPYSTLDNLTIGEDNGIKGGICNVIYYKKALDSMTIKKLYSQSKGLDPPVISNNNETIINIAKQTNKYIDNL